MICASLFFLVASFTFYLADSDDRELPSPKGSEDNVVSFAHLDPSESQISVGTEPEDELTVSGVTPDGFDLTWTLKAHGVYDSLTVAYKDARPLRDAREAQLPGDAAGSRIRGLNASTEYQIKLYGITGSQRSALLEAVAVTGISSSFRLGTLCPLFEGGCSGYDLHAGILSIWHDVMKTNLTDRLTRARLTSRMLPPEIREFRPHLSV